MVLPLASSASDDFGEKPTKLVVPTCDTPTAQNVCDDRTFECRVDGATGQRRIHIMIGQRVLPRPGDRFDFFVLGRTIRGAVANTSAPSLAMPLWDNVIAHDTLALTRLIRVLAWHLAVFHLGVFVELAASGLVFYWRGIQVSTLAFLVGRERDKDADQSNVDASVLAAQEYN